ncbi:7552_t:CDS:2 [Funneliformis mosseae]|uniref:7552_t:CDS:1 n=1 Tax=Funneliformis mosseae TaxID=27381 RepID=A0A9N8ZX86_FUNMO|nr:7552_t:CDS:2 [Funneliformis mosseae]
MIDILLVLDKKNIDPFIYQLQNLKVHYGKGRPVSTKKYKLEYEVLKVKTNQRRCKKCKDIRHYQRTARRSSVISS